MVEAGGTSEDAAFLLAHEKGAETIVAVGSHGNLREFLDKGREGMSSTFWSGSRRRDPDGRQGRLARLLIADPNARRVPPGGRRAGRDRGRVVVSPPLRLYVSQLVEQFRQWLFDLKELL